ncbi:MAG: aldo/keto reductase [Planctomycetes bacterium]|nr:aldo/keto reductase [Planctomycetota bacterium]
MKTTRLGARGPEVSVIGFGAWAIGGRSWGKTDDAVSKRALHAAFDGGVTFVDTADVYGNGHSERLIAEVLGERSDRDRIVVATKAGNDFYNATPADDHGYGAMRSNADADYLVFAAEQSLQRLGVDCLDILQLHSHATDLLDRDEPWSALERLKRDGKIRHAGWSLSSYKETEQTYLLERHADLIDVIQVRYNVLEREAERTLFPAAIEHGTGVIVRIPLLFGLLAGKFSAAARFADDDHRRFNLAPEKLQEYLALLDRARPLYDAFPEASLAQTSLRFAISHPACHVAIPGAKTEEQVRENVRAGESGPLPATFLERL